MENPWPGAPPVKGFPFADFPPWEAAELSCLACFEFVLVFFWVTAPMAAVPSISCEFTWLAASCMSWEPPDWTAPLLWDVVEKDSVPPAPLSTGPLDQPQRHRQPSGPFKPCGAPWALPYRPILLSSLPESCGTDHIGPDIAPWWSNHDRREHPLRSWTPSSMASPKLLDFVLPLPFPLCKHSQPTRLDCWEMIFAKTSLIKKGGYHSWPCARPLPKTVLSASTHALHVMRSMLQTAGSRKLGQEPNGPSNKIFPNSGHRFPNTWAMWLLGDDSLKDLIQGSSKRKQFWVQKLMHFMSSIPRCKLQGLFWWCWLPASNPGPKPSCRRSP